MSARHPRSALRNRAEWLGLMLAQAIFQALPARGARRVGRFFGALGYWVDARHRRIAQANVATALGVPPDAAARIARRSFGHGGEMLAEMAWAPRRVRDPRYLDGFELRRFEPLFARVKAGQGAILAAAHLGNWEITSFCFPREGIPLTTVARPLDNPLLDALLIGRRKIQGQGILYKADANREGTRLLRAGGVLALVCDQRAKKSSVTVPFFGRPALTTVGPAMLAFRTKTPIFVGGTWRRPDGRHVFELAPAIDPVSTGDLRADLARVTAEVNARLEAFIRRAPEQYLWAHDRWRPPREGDAAREDGRPVGGTGPEDGDEDDET